MPLRSAYARLAAACRRLAMRAQHPQDAWDQKQPGPGKARPPGKLVEVKAADVSLRRRAEAAALRVLQAPDLGREALALLSDEEFAFRQAELEASTGDTATEPAEEFAVRRAYAEGAPVRYLVRGVPVEPSDNLPAPQIRVDSAGVRPGVSIPRIHDEDGREALYYFEFDTSPLFNTPNFWRYPALVPLMDKVNLTVRDGLQFLLLQTPHRGIHGNANAVTFPFRASAMRLPEDFAALDFEALQRHARALIDGLEGQEAIGEVFRYVRQTCFWAADTLERAPLDTFRAGMGECGHANDLAGTLLEMSGYRYRGVAGFHPVVREIYPGGGHSAIEVHDGRGWSYLDSYLDIMAPGIPASRLRESRYGELPVYPLPEEERGGRLGSHVTLRELFAYRIYFDKLGRLPTINMFSLGGDEESYGLQWPLELAPEFAPHELFPAQIRIHVRARHLFAGGARIEHVSSPLPWPQEAMVSPWGQTSFVVKPAG